MWNLWRSAEAHDFPLLINLPTVMQPILGCKTGPTGLSLVILKVRNLKSFHTKLAGTRTSFHHTNFNLINYNVSSFIIIKFKGKYTTRTDTTLLLSAYIEPQKLQTFETSKTH